MQSKAHLQKQSVDRFKHGCVPGGLLIFRDIFHFRGEKEKKRKEKKRQDKTRQERKRKEKKRKEKKRKEKKRKEKKRKEKKKRKLFKLT